MSQPRPSSRGTAGGTPPQPHQQNGRWTHPLLIAVAGPLVGGIFAVAAVYVGQSKGVLPTPAGATTAAEETTVTSPTTADLTTSPSTASSVPAAGSPPIRHEGDVTLAKYGDMVDINAPSSDPTWGAPAGRKDSIGFYSDIATPDTLLFYQLDAVKLDRGDVASYENCSTRTDYAGLDSGEVSGLEGLDICVRSSSGRFAVVRVTGYDDDSVTLHITTWELE
jgi:hypothetical protein